MAEQEEYQEGREAFLGRHGYWNVLVIQINEVFCNILIFLASSFGNVNRSF